MQELDAYKRLSKAKKIEVNKHLADYNADGKTSARPNTIEEVKIQKINQTQYQQELERMNTPIRALYAFPTWCSYYKNHLPNVKKLDENPNIDILFVSLDNYAEVKRLKQQLWNADIKEQVYILDNDVYGEQWITYKRLANMKKEILNQNKIKSSEISTMFLFNEDLELLEAKSFLPDENYIDSLVAIIAN